MDGENLPKIKEEVDIYEYEGAPSPEAPVYDLIPFKDILPNNKLRNSKALLKHQTAKKETDTLYNDNFFINMEDLEKEYTFFKKRYASNVEPEELAGAKVIKYDKTPPISNFKSMKDASTETGPDLLESYICAVCRGYSTKFPGEVNDIAGIKIESPTDGNGNVTDFSQSQDPPVKN